MKKLIILGAGKNKHIDENPSFLISKSEQTFLDWQIKTGKSLGCSRIDYIAGYQIALSQIEKLHELRFIINSQWNHTKSLYSLLLVDFEENEDLYICYNDVLLHDDFLQEIFYKCEPDNIIALIDKTFPKRYAEQDYDCETIEKDGCLAEFVGFVYIPKKCVHELIEMQRDIEKYKNYSVSDFIKKRNFINKKTDLIDAASNWCDINFPNELPRFIIKGKAKTLSNLKKALSASYFLDQVSFSTLEWKENAKDIYKRINHFTKSKYIAVRSSAYNEDGFLSSNAGVYASHLGVSLENFNDFETAVNQTIASYNNGFSEKDLILVQPYIDNADLHGVVFSRSHQGGPYYVFNYAHGDDTSSVTGGYARDSKTLILFRKTIENFIPEHLKNVYKAIIEIEEFLDHIPLDIEFVITTDKKCYILQVRPQVSYQHESVIQNEKISVELSILNEQLKEKENHPLFEGLPLFFGVMPDWNPAEIIGRKPMALARSLYEEIITNEIWAKQRSEFGYHDLVSYPLMDTFCGHPYVDVRASFLSFVPKNVNHDTSLKLVRSSLNYLKKNPYLHDKVEFDVIPTCYQFDFDDHFLHIKNDLTATEHLEIKENYQKLTFNAIYFDSKKNFYSPLPEMKRNSIFELLRNSQIGALSFSHEARKAFIATILLKSLVRVGALSQSELDLFYRSLNTISREFTRDAYLCKVGKIERTFFINKYGHLRPGTYDITAPRYDADVSTFIDPIIEGAQEHSTEIFACNFSMKNKVEKYIQELSPSLDFNTFITFAKNSIESRERVKFLFTKDVSQLLEHIGKFATNNEMSHHDISFCHFNFLKNFIYNSNMGQADLSLLKDIIEQSKQIYEITKKIELPSVISNKDDIFGFYHEKSQPNFITSQKALLDFVVFNKNYSDQLKGKAVFIENADPGYEWIFAEKIAALVTMYGGINSHMAVRASELNIPSVIGIGEKKSSEIMSAKKIFIDCLNKILDPVF